MKNKEFIKEKLFKLLNDKYKIDIYKTATACDLNLLGKTIKMAASDLLSFFLDVEKEFNIVISEGDIIEGRFKTINSITDVVYEKLA